jgi:hypothetical protein
MAAGNRVPVLNAIVYREEMNELSYGTKTRTTSDTA